MSCVYAEIYRYRAALRLTGGVPQDVQDSINAALDAFEERYKTLDYLPAAMTDRWDEFDCSLARCRSELPPSEETVREVTPFRTLDHIAGVHYVAMRVARAFSASGGLIDLGLISGAALGHDLGKFGCKPGERVPYLHYYYTDQWFTRRGLTALGHIAANHSVWDLEIENLSSESLTLVYADFRVKQTYDAQRREIPCLYSLQEAFDVILSKLDNVDDAKRLRYQYV